MSPKKFRRAFTLALLDNRRLEAPPSLCRIEHRVASWLGTCCVAPLQSSNNFCWSPGLPHSFFSPIERLNRRNVLSRAPGHKQCHRSRTSAVIVSGLLHCSHAGCASLLCKWERCSVLWHCVAPHAYVLCHVWHYGFVWRNRYDLCCNVRLYPRAQK